MSDLVIRYITIDQTEHYTRKYLFYGFYNVSVTQFVSIYSQNLTEHIRKDITK